MKKFTFEKGQYHCTLTVCDDASLLMKIDDGEEFLCRDLQYGNIEFFTNETLIRNGKKFS